MIRANDNLAILSAEAPINSPLMTDGAAFVQLEEEFRQAFEMTLIDLPRNMLINFPHLLTDVNVVVVATELTLASARDAIRILSWLKSNAPHARPIVVANSSLKPAPRGWRARTTSRLCGATSARRRPPSTTCPTPASPSRA